jgi:hypothetical protein
MATVTSVFTPEEIAREQEAPRDGRRRKRISVSLPLHVRPFDTRFAEIEDVGQVVNFTRDGILFLSCMPHYFVGMRLIVTFPFGDNVSAHRRFLGVVVRMEERPKGGTGVAVRFLL